MLPIRRLGVLFASLLVVSLILGLGTVPTAASPDKSGQAVAFAHIDSAGTLLSSGGKGTASTTSSRVGAGHYLVTFTGNYPPTAVKASYVIQATAESTQFGVANGRVLSANSTTILAECWTWISNNLVTVDNPCSVTIHVGR